MKILLTLNKFFLYALIVLLSINVRAESNAIPIKLDKQALLNFAKASKQTVNKTGSLLESIQQLTDLWDQYDAAADEATRVQLATDLSQTIKQADKNNKRWGEALSQERTKVITLLKTSTNDEFANITISSLKPEIASYAQPLMERYFDGLSPDKMKSSGIKNMMISVRDGLRGRRLKQGQDVSTKGFYTTEDLVSKISSLDDNRVISSVLNDIYIEMAGILSQDIQNGVLSATTGANQNKVFFDTTRNMLGMTKRTSKSGSDLGSDASEFRYNPFGS